MAEVTENVRADSRTREDKQKEITDWGGRRLAIPTGTALPTVSDDLMAGEVFVLQKAAANDELYIYDTGAGAWVKVGP